MKIVVVGCVVTLMNDVGMFIKSLGGVLNLICAQETRQQAMHHVLQRIEFYQKNIPSNERVKMKKTEQSTGQFMRQVFMTVAFCTTFRSIFNIFYSHI